MNDMYNWISTLTHIHAQTRISVLYNQLFLILSVYNTECLGLCAEEGDRGVKHKNVLN